MTRTLTWQEVTDAVDAAYEDCKKISGGVNAHYIPYLANVNPDLFAISVCAADGRLHTVGDGKYRFGIESVSKVPTAIAVLREIGPEQLLEKIGADATGLPYNSIFALLLEKDHPSTPLVNAGAICACSLISPKGDSNAKWAKIFANMTDLLGSEPELIKELYESESNTNFENRSISWLLRQYNRIYDDPTMSLDLYTRQCSLGVTAEQLAICAATICADGMNPVTKKQVFDPSYAQKVVSMIGAVGFYQHTGDWLYESGLPAKTGVGGGVMGVMPGLFGICAFSPPLDSAGNSVKAQAALKQVMSRLGLGVYSNTHFELE